MPHLRYFFIFILIIVAASAIYPEFKGIYSNIPSLFQEADKSLLIFLMLFQGLNYLGGGWLFQTLSSIAGFKVRLIDTMRIAILSVVGNHLAPFFGGLAVTFLSFRKLGIPAEVISFLIPLWYFFIYITYVFFFLISLILLPSLVFQLISFEKIIAIAFGFVLISVIFFILFIKKKYFTLILNKLLKVINKVNRLFYKKDPVWPESIRKSILSFDQNINFLLQNNRKIPQILLTSLFFYFGDYPLFLLFDFWLSTKFYYSYCRLYPIFGFNRSVSNTICPRSHGGIFNDGFH